MITNLQAQAAFDKGINVIEAIPTAQKRIVIPAYNFEGATSNLDRPEWGPNGQFVEKVDGVAFNNRKDNAVQVLKKKDGCILCYYTEERFNKITQYLKAHPDALKTADNILKFISFIHTLTPDVWDSDLNFAKGLKNAPQNLAVGHVFAAAKKSDTVKALAVKAGEEFEGPTKNSQVAGSNGAFIVLDKAGLRLVQKEEFYNAYSVQMPVAQIAKQQSR